MTQADLHARAVLVNLNIRSWSARKFDRAISKEIADAHGTDIDAGRYNKKLMPADAPSYKALNKHLQDLREDVHYANTLPWSDKGWRLLPVRNYARYTDAVRKGINDAEALLDTFVADYPELRAEVKRQRNGMVTDEDFPVDIRTRYNFKVDINPVPSGGDFRVELSREEIDVIEAGTQARVQKAFEDAQNDAVKRLYSVVAKMHERLSQPDAIFRDTLLQNVRDVCDVITGLNLTDDPNLETLRRQTELLAGATETQTLRDDAKIRIDTATQAQSILDAMTSTYGKGLFA